MRRSEFLRALWACTALLAGGSYAQSQTQPGVSAQELLIGQFAAMNGPAAELGQRLHAGIKAYFKAVNAEGGIHGRTLRLVVRDDGYEPQRSEQAVRQLIGEDGVFALIGSVGTPTGLAALPIVGEAKVPLVGMFTGAPTLREPMSRYVFHTRATYADETERIVQYLSTLGVKKISVFYQNDAYGQAGLDGVKQALSKRGLKPVGTSTFERNSADITNALAAMLDAQPEAVVQIGAYQACAAFIQQARAKGFTGQFFNVSFVGAKALSDALGPVGKGVVISQVVPFPYAASSVIVRDYQQHMKAAGETAFDFSSMEGYVMAKVLAEGLRRTGKTPTREGLVAALESMDKVNLGGFEIHYSPSDHRGTRFTDLAIIGEGGKFLR